jgi:glycosyltransferase involved in cell wall biosynthesis
MQGGHQTATGTRPIRIAICWTGTAGYLTASWRALAAVSGVTQKVFTFPFFGRGSAPLKTEQLAGLSYELLDEHRWSDVAYLGERVAEFKPDVVALCGWVSPGFSGLPFHPKLRSVRFMMGIDTQWSASLKLRLGRYRHRRLFARIRRVMVAGDRGVHAAEALGFPVSRIRRGMYGTDVAPLVPLYDRRLVLSTGWPRSFLFAARLVPEKGVEVLSDAYQAYRKVVSQPWDLICMGTGPLERLLKDVPGVRLLGFVQPPEQPAVWLDAGTFILSSVQEPWGVVVCEAAAAGLPIICTDVSGAGIDVVRPYYNGLIIPSGDVGALTSAMVWMHENYADLATMGGRSRPFGDAHSAEIWAKRWHAAAVETLEDR